MDDKPPPEKKRGRPRVSLDASAPVSTVLPEPYVDKLIKAASDRGLSVSALSRQILMLGLKRL